MVVRIASSEQYSLALAASTLCGLPFCFSQAAW